MRLISWRWLMPRWVGSCTRRRCRMSVMSCIILVGIVVVRRAMGLIASHLIVPGFGSSRIHIVNVADDPRAPWIEKVIEPQELVAKTGYTRPHTCPLPGGRAWSRSRCSATAAATCPAGSCSSIRIRVLGRWENERPGCGVQLRFLVSAAAERVVSRSRSLPEHVRGGFDLADVAAGRYGSRLHFWDLEGAPGRADLDLGDQGRIRSRSAGCTTRRRQGYVGAALSSNDCTPPRTTALDRPTR